MKWVIEGKVNVGTFCTTQGMTNGYLLWTVLCLTVPLGILQQLGATSVALATLVSILVSRSDCHLIQGPRAP
jgi:hypothetical protein